jgi:TolB-like protein/DNA-binding winged helix-turn-helix (wHTH) protein/Tfp pilus assembly protein PilF
VATEPVPIHQTIRFGDDLELDLGAYQLRRADRVLKLEPTPMELLHFLLEHKGELVTREQIIERLWGRNVFVDTDNSINGAIRKIRLVLNDETDRPRYVQTVPGKGYRFIAPVAPSPVEIPTVMVSIQAKQVEPPAEFKGPSRRFTALAIAVLALLIAAGVFAWMRWRNGSNSTNPRLMLAILPFQNLTGDPAQEYFSDGLTEEMIAQLGRLDPKRLGVIARTSVMHYKQSQSALTEIAHDLQVQYVLEGSVRRDAGKVRITAQLIQTKDQTHLWARQYDRDEGSLLRLQGEIAQEIADQIQLTLGAQKRTLIANASVPPQTYAAYDLYLKGRYFWNKRTTDGFQQAIEYFGQAIAIDPSYARAYAGLADCYALLGGYSVAPQKDFESRARSAALQALKIDPSLPEAHASLAVIAQNYDWDWQTAEEQYRQAISIDPNYATAHHWYAEFLSFQGRFDEAFAEIERARQLDPLSLIIATDKGAILYYSRQYDQSIAQFHSVLEMEPNFPRARLIVFPYVEKGMFSPALEQLEKWPASDDPWILMLKVDVYSHSGKTKEANAFLSKLEHLTENRKFDSAPLLCAYAAIGDKEKTFQWMEKAYSEHSTALTSLKVNPLYDSLRGDSRFEDYLRRVGLSH